MLRLGLLPTRALRCAPPRRGNATLARLQTDLKTAMKTKDAFAATVLRSVLADVYAAQKHAPAAADVPAIVRKAERRRHDAMLQFERAARPDLAQAEQKEAALLAAYLPPPLSPAAIDAALRPLIPAAPAAHANPQRAKGLCLQAFYAAVDKNSVDGALVRSRIDALWPAAL